MVVTPVNDYIGTVGTCPLGASVNSFYIESSFDNVDIDFISRIDWYLAKPTQGTGFSALPVPGSTGGSTSRNRIFHESKGLSPAGNAVGEGRQVSRTVKLIKVPFKYRRMGEGDIWGIRIGSSEAYSACYKIIYKWFT